MTGLFMVRRSCRFNALCIVQGLFCRCLADRSIPHGPGNYGITINPNGHSDFTGKMSRCVFGYKYTADTVAHVTASLTTSSIPLKLRLS